MRACSDYRIDNCITSVETTFLTELQYSSLYLITNNMKNISILCFAVALCITACSKTSPHTSQTTSVDSGYYVTLFIDGDSVAYTANTGALKQNYATMNVFGYASNATNADGVNILFQLLRDVNTNVGPGMYSDTANYNPTDDPNRMPDSSNNFAPIYFNTNQANVTLQLSGAQYLSNGIVDVAAGTPFVCTITAMDSLSVSGTFSGSASFSGTIKKMTSGRFHVPL